MPIYEFKCEDCSFKFEVLFLTINEYEKSKVRCPNCKSKNIKRLISSPGGFKFKGLGFYETEYKRRKNNKNEK